MGVRKKIKKRSESVRGREVMPGRKMECKSDGERERGREDDK